MPSTTVHIPEQLLKEIDQAAKERNISRNRFINESCVLALKNRVGDWPEGFFKVKESELKVLREASIELEQAVYSHRKNRGAVVL